MGKVKDYDLIFRVYFPDGSVFDDRFKRHCEMHPKTLEMVPTVFFINSFMPGADLMRESEIRSAFKTWMDRGHENYLSIKYIKD